MIARAGTKTRLPERFIEIFITLLVFVALLDPSDQIFHLKVPLFVGVIVSYALSRGINRSTISLGTWAITITVSLILPLICTTIGLLNSDIHSDDNVLAVLKSFLFLLVIPILINENIDLLSRINRMSIVIASLTIALAIAGVIAPALFLLFYQFSLDKQNAIISTQRDVIGIGLGQIYYKTSSVMVFPFLYYLWEYLDRRARRMFPLLMIVLFAVALLASGTRANVIASALMGCMSVLIKLRQKRGWGSVVLFVLIASAVLGPFVISRAFDPTEESNAVKLGHARSYANEFSEHPQILLWGEGAATAFYSEGVRDWKAGGTELTYLEIVRLFGIPITMGFAVGLLWIAYALYRKRKWYMLTGYLAYLAISGSNPLLISSTGLLVICAMWKEAVTPPKDSVCLSIQSVQY